MTSPTPARIALTPDSWVRDPAHRGNASPAAAAMAAMPMIVKYLELPDDGLTRSGLSCEG